MPYSLAEAREFVLFALEALGRYKLRTSLSVLGVVLGVAAVVAMMSVSEGAAREALAQVDALGLDNLVARSQTHSAHLGARGLVAGDADRLQALVPLVHTASPLVERWLKIVRRERSLTTRVLGVRPAFQTILRLSVARGRFLSPRDEETGAFTCVLGAVAARQMFGYRQPIGERVRIGHDYYQVVGVLQERGSTSTNGSLAWHDINRVVFVPFASLSGHTLAIAPNQPADEIWLQVREGERAAALAQILDHTLERLRGHHEFSIVVPRELLAQRYRTQRTFSVVVGSVAALALLIGGIGIMNIMLTSVVERTREIGVRRTVGATRRDVTLQFLTETLMMTIGGGALGIAIGVAASWGITSFAGWNTYVSPLAVVLALVVSCGVGLVFGWYPAIKAANLQPVDAMRYE